MAKRATCNKCLRPEIACYCHTILQIETPSQILIIRHFKEKEHPFNTARMAELSIPNCRVIDSDQENYKEILQEFIDKYNPFMVFYTHETNDLKENIPNLPSKNFILLDGTWDKARKILFTNPVLQKLKMFHLNPVEETLYKPIRKACSEGFISTLEATKETLETLYPDKKISGLLSPLKYTVELQLKLRN